MTTQLGKLSIGLVARNGVALKGLGGESLHSLFYQVLKNHSPELASEIHAQDGLKPFSLTPPIKDYQAGMSCIIVPPEATLNFDLSFMTAKLLSATISALVSMVQDGNMLMLSRKPIVVTSLDLCNGSFSSFENVISEASPNNSIELEFITPTSFKRNEIQAVFPEAGLVFSSLLNRWNTFSDRKIAEDCINLFPSIKVSRYNLTTELINFSKYKMLGFTGRVEYEMPKGAPDTFLREMNALASFATYSGVGVKTSMGMGQVRRVV